MFFKPVITTCNRNSRRMDNKTSQKQFQFTSLRKKVTQKDYLAARARGENLDMSPKKHVLIFVGDFTVNIIGDTFHVQKAIKEVFPTAKFDKSYSSYWLTVEDYNSALALKNGEVGVKRLIAAADALQDYVIEIYRGPLEEEYLYQLGLKSREPNPYQNPQNHPQPQNPSSSTP